MTEVAQLQEQLVRIEAKLDRLIEHMDRVEPLITAGEELSAKIEKGGPMALLGGFSPFGK